MWPLSTPNYLKVGQKKQTSRSEAIGTQSTRALPDGAEVYLRATASDIVQRISKGEWTASEVLEAYIARAVLSQELTNCLTEVFFSQARAEASSLDEEFASTRRLRGPLHGVPVSLKDLFDVKGYDTTMGYSTLADKPAAEDAHLVSMVRAAGGIPIAKTNLAQMMFFFECSNPVWGRTINPHGKSYTPGGSSGGEGALLAMDGAALGWGSDIGGSLRIPASFCGIYSLKPGWSRISMTGVQDTMPGLEGIRSVVGPMARSVEDLELAARLVFGKQGAEYDPAPLPYREVELPRKLRFGYYVSDGYIKASPACKRAVLETVEALCREGHECVEVEIPEVTEAMKIFMSITNADGLKTAQEPLGKDPIEVGISGVILIVSLYGWVRYLLAWMIGTLFGDNILAGVLLSEGRSVQELHKAVVRRNEYTRMFYREVWDKHQLDGIIAPVLALPALPHEYLAMLATGACVYNVLNVPVGTIPVTRVQLTDLTTAEWTDPRVGHGHGSPLVEWLLYGRLDKKTGHGKGGYYNPEKMAGLPVGVQLVGKKWEEEKVVEMMKVVDSALGPRGFGPFSWTGQKE